MKIANGYAIREEFSRELLGRSNHLKSAQIWAVSRGTKIGFTASKLKRYNQF